jgi:hypothetical protein
VQIGTRLRAGSTAAWLIAAAVGLLVVAVVALGVSLGLGLFGGSTPHRQASAAPDVPRPVASTQPTSSPPPSRPHRHKARKKKAHRHVQATRPASSAPTTPSVPSSGGTQTAPAVPPVSTPRPQLSTPRPRPAPPVPAQPPLVTGGGGGGGGSAAPVSGGGEDG